MYADVHFLVDGPVCTSNRPGIYAWDRSYWQLYLSFCGNTRTCPPNALNVSLEWTRSSATSATDSAAGDANGADDDLGLIATVVKGNDANVSDYVLTVTGGYAWGRTGSATIVSIASTCTPIFLKQPPRCALRTRIGYPASPSLVDMVKVAPTPDILWIRLMLASG